MAGFHGACPSPPASVAPTASTRAACTRSQRPARGPCPARDRPRRRRSSRPADAGPTCGAGCAERKVKEERGEVVYRPSAAPAAPRRSANCRAQRGRSCEQGASEGGDCSLIGPPFFSGKKTWHRKSATLCSMREAFERKDAAFMSISRPKVTQLARGTLDWLKTCTDRELTQLLSQLPTPLSVRQN